MERGKTEQARLRDKRTKKIEKERGSEWARVDSLEHE